MSVSVLMVICEVCEKREAVGVAAVPGVAYSAAYCDECLRANAHPWSILVSNIWCIGGLEFADREWQQMVYDTAAYLGKTIEEFNQAVSEVEQRLSTGEFALFEINEELDKGKGVE